jgi:hypothetical protein
MKLYASYSKIYVSTIRILNCSHLNFRLEPSVYLSENRLLSPCIAEIHSTMRITCLHLNFLFDSLVYL